MTNILMVCLGNICRSPLAHGILKSKLPSTNYIIDSAGTANYHVGDAPDLRSIKVAKSNGIDISKQKGQQFKVAFFDEFDLIYVMDESNFDDIIRLARNSRDTSKVKLILDECPSLGIKNVPDPYYGDDSSFEYVYNLLNKVCDNIVIKLQD
jgi:protein-tyrosine phosphatase